MNQQPQQIKPQTLSQFYARSQMICSWAYDFKGTVDIDLIKEAIAIIYNNDPIFGYNIEDNHKEPETFMFEKNSEEYQQEIDKVEKVVVKQIKDIKSELGYLHNYSWDEMLFNGKSFLPIRLFVLQGYKENEFCLVFCFNHVYMDGTNMSNYINFTLQLYSLLYKKQSTLEMEKMLQARRYIDDEIILDRFKPRFWATFINILRIVKTNSQGDPGKLCLEFKEGEKIYEEQYEKHKKEGIVQDKGYQLIGSFDFSQIFRTVRDKYPQVSKNSICHAFWGVVFQDYNTTVRAKELGKEKEEFEGKTTFGYSIKHLNDELFKQHSGCYSGLGHFTYDSRNINLDDLSLQFHNSVQARKKTNFGLNSQLFFCPFFNNSERMMALINSGDKSNYLSSSWTNYELQQNPKMLEGAEIINFSQGFTEGSTPGAPEYPNGLLGSPILIINIGPKDIVGFTYFYLDTKTNIGLWEHFNKMYQDLIQKIGKSKSTGEEIAQNTV